MKWWTKLLIGTGLVGVGYLGYDYYKADKLSEQPVVIEQKQQCPEPEVIERIVEVPVEKIIEIKVPVPVEKIVYKYIAAPKVEQITHCQLHDNDEVTFVRSAVDKDKAAVCTVDYKSRQTVVKLYDKLEVPTQRTP